jgi:hypothetical protein
MKAASVGRLLMLGGLWGVGMTAMESFSTPLEGMTFDEVASFVLLVGGHYVAAAMTLSFGCAWLEPRLTAPQLALALVMFAALEAAVHTGVLVFAQHVGAATGLQALFVRPRSVLTAFLYDFWPVCFYGGLFVTAITFNARAERRRNLLGQMQVAADYADAEADQAQAAALNAGLQPSFLLQATTRLQQLYDADPAGAGRLMTELVTFLRAAGVSNRSVVSTLAEELALVESYAQVRARLGQPGRLSVAFDLPLPKVRFPGSMLLPAVDRLLNLGDAEVVLRDECLSFGGRAGGQAFCADTEAYFRQALHMAGDHRLTRREEEDATWLDVHLFGPLHPAWSPVCHH